MLIVKMATQGPVKPEAHQYQIYTTVTYTWVQL